jgi:hypothetical protein
MEDIDMKDDLSRLSPMKAIEAEKQEIANIKKKL